MSGEVRIEMPTDLHSGGRQRPARLEIEEESFSNGSTSWRKRGITSLTVETPTGPHFPTDPIAVSKPRWKTPEFIIYVIVVVFAVALMVHTAVQLSSSEYYM